jgi:hypothetical protein
VRWCWRGGTDRDGAPDTEDDNDGLADEFETEHGLDPRNSDADHDGIVDGQVVEWMEEAVAGLPTSAFRSRAAGQRNAITAQLSIPRLRSRVRWRLEPRSPDRFSFAGEIDAKLPVVECDRTVPILIERQGVSARCGVAIALRHRKDPVNVGVRIRRET